MSIYKKNTAIVIPVYKRQPTKSELLSLSKGLQVLHQYPIYFISPYGLDLTSYKLDHIGFEVQYFANHYFDGVKGYNKLLLSKHFYQRFINFDYMLIYQLDALVFQDSLDEWIKKDYDYIGAPWLKSPITAFFSVSLHVSIVEGLKMLFQNKLKNPVGNGGLSLRKVKSCILALEENQILVKKWNANEDYFWSYFATNDQKPLKIPSKSEALFFSVETKPEEAFKVLKSKLPFGAHDWETYNRPFWNSLLWKMNYFGGSKITVSKSKLSIIIIASESKNLEKTFQSIRKNSYNNLELIVINSSSDYKTLSLMKKNQDLISKWSWGPVENPSESMNKGLELASGQYVWFMQGGQQIHHHLIFDSVFKEEDYSDVYFGHSLVHYRNGRIKAKTRVKPPPNLSWKSLPFSRFDSSSAFIVKKELAPKFEPKYTYSGILDWQIKVLKRANKVEYTGLIFDELLDQKLKIFEFDALLKERFQVIKSNYGILKSIINQSLVYNAMLIKYLRNGRFTLNNYFR